MAAKPTVTLIGAGNVATHFGMAMKKAGWKVSQVYNRQTKGAKLLAKKLNAEACTQISNLAFTHIYILSVKDDALPEVIAQLAQHSAFKNKKTAPLLLHTSGAVAIDVLAKASNSYGWIYPLQSIKRNVPLDIKSVPIGIEASDKESLVLLTKLAKSISNHTFSISPQQKLALHVAAVFTNNFTNHIIDVAQTIALKHKFDYQILVPLLSNTFSQTLKGKAHLLQTGPAIRHDQKTIKKHLAFLSHEKNWQKVYIAMTNSIQNSFKKDLT